MAAYGDITIDAWVAIAIGAVGLVLLIARTVAAVMRWRRSRHSVTRPQAAPACREPHREDGIPYWRCHDLIAEGLIVRERVTGHIDAATYQARMSGLVCGARR